MIRSKFYTLSMLLFLNAFVAQDKKINGKVMTDGMPLQDVEVINRQAKKSVKTNSSGEFSILATPNDELIVYVQNYPLKKLTVSEKDFTSNNLVIQMIKQSIELKEVEVTKEEALFVSNGLDVLKAVEIENNQARPKPLGVYTGETPNAIDFVKVGEKLMLLFKGEKHNIPRKDEVEAFKNYIERNFDVDFFVNKLQLSEKEIPFFIDFCCKDFAVTKIPKKNELDVIQFLLQERKKYKN